MSGLPGVDVITNVNGAPQVSWGDTFLFYHPGGGIPVVPVNGGRR